MGATARRGGAKEMAALERHSETSAAEESSLSLRIAAITLRTLFILTMLAIVVVVSAPQNETLWTVYDTTGDLVRLIIGILVCVWLFFQLFHSPRDTKAYRTWLYLGLFAEAFALLCLYVVW
jgi:hypothetical protein